MASYQQPAFYSQPPTAFPLTPNPQHDEFSPLVRSIMASPLLHSASSASDSSPLFVQACLSSQFSQHGYVAELTRSLCPGLWRLQRNVQQLSEQLRPRLSRVRTSARADVTDPTRTVAHRQHQSRRKKQQRRKGTDARAAGKILLR